MFHFLFITSLFLSAMLFAENITSPPSPITIISSPAQSQPSFKGSNEEAQGVSIFMQSFEVAWNTRNISALASLWNPDGDLITAWGRWMMGPLQIEKYFNKESQGSLGKTQIHLSIDATRFINPQIVIIDATLRMTHVLNTKGESTDGFLQHALFVLTKVNKDWKITSLRLYQFQVQPLE